MNVNGKSIPVWITVTEKFALYTRGGQYFSV
jgi:hypothetical protein